MNINIDLTDIKGILPPAYHWMLTDQHRYKVLVGGAGSGKSWSIAINILFKMLMDFDKYPHHILALRKTSPAAKRSIFALFNNLISMWNLEPLCSINKTDLSISWINGSQILIGGMDDPSKIKSLESTQTIWLEEVSEHTRDTFLQCDLRLRGQTDIPFSVYLSLNPVSKSVFVYKDFILNKRPNSIVRNTTYLDNPYLDEEYKKTLRELIDIDEMYYKVYSLGEWADLKGTIFSNWEIIKEMPKHYTNNEFVIGIDWGWTHPSAIIRVVKDGDKLFIEELLYESKRTNQDLIEWVKKHLPSNSIIYGDSAEPNRIEEMRRENINISRAIKGPDSVRNSIDHLNRHKMYITENSVNLIDELQSYRWKLTKEGEATDSPIDYHEDAIAALRYAVHSHFGNKRSYEVFY